MNKYKILCGDNELDLSTPKVMGILNLTPDSFYDGGKIISKNDILKKVGHMLDEGAHIVDIGAVSTRPGAKEVPAHAEIEKLLPGIKIIKQNFPDSIISIDTYRSYVASLAIDAGADMINDISGGTFDTNMIETISKLKVPYIIMHILGTPENMQINPQYKNVTEEVFQFFSLQLQTLAALDMHNNIILDPGFGFGKTLEHNYNLLKNISRIKELGFPLLAGVSRKSMINKVLGTLPENALNGTTTVNTIALMNGANILRVHDVKQAVEAIQIFNYYKSI